MPTVAGFKTHRWYESGTGRYTRVDPIRLLGQATNVYGYAFNNPLKWFDPLGLIPVCCTELPEDLKKEAEAANQRARDLESGEGFEIPAGSVVTGSTVCGGLASGGPGSPDVFFHPPFFRLGPCQRECVRVHEGSHADLCRKYGPVTMSMGSLGDLDEALAYQTEALCLVKAARNGNIDVDAEFPELVPIPSP